MTDIPREKGLSPADESGVDVPDHYVHVGHVRDALDAVDGTKHAVEAVDWAYAEDGLYSLFSGHEHPEALRAALTMVAIRAISTFDKAVMRAGQDQAIPSGGDQ